jgi:hypothetical protein
MKDIYVDRFMKCNVSQGVVRLDFGRVENIDHDKNEVSMSPASRLVLPIDSFLHFAEQVAQLKDKLVSQGYSDSGVDADAVKEGGDIGTKPKKTKSVH